MHSEAEARRNAVHKSLETFKSEIRTIDEIDTILTKQDTFMTKSGENVTSELQRQTTALEELQKIQTTDRETLEVLRESFTSNVLKGVQTLIDEQMNMMKTENIRHFDVCDLQNQKLMKQNVSLTDSTKSAYNKVSSDNKILTDKSKRVRKNENDATEAMDAAQTTFGDLQAAATKQEESTSVFARKFENNISKLSKLDVDADEIVERLHSNENDLTKHLEDTILTKGSENLKLLAKGGRDLSSYGDTVLIPECYASLDSMEAPRPDVMQNFNALTKKNKERLERGKLEVESISEKQCIKTDETRTYVRSKEDYFKTNICKMQKTQLDNQKDKLLLQTKEYGGSTVKTVSNCSSSTSTVKVNMENFVDGTIKAREDVDPLVERTKAIFNDNLTSTPENHIICSELNFEEEMAIGVES